MNELTISDLPNYQNFLDQVTTQIRQTRTKAAQSVNREAISLYWWLGEHIIQHQNQYGWGKSVVERLSKDLYKSLSRCQIWIFNPKFMGYAAFLPGI